MSDDFNKSSSGQGAQEDRRGGFVRDKDMPPGGEGKLGKGKRRRKVSYLTINKIETVDYKDVNVLRRFINDRGKILPSRHSGNTAKQQRMISRAVRRARELALLPFVVGEMSAERREFTPRRERYNDRGPREHQQHSAEPAAPQEKAAEPEVISAEAVPTPAPVEAPAATEES